MSDNYVSEITLVPIGDLVEAEWNPRFMPEDQRQALIESMSMHGIVEPAVVRGSDMLIIGGHQRVAVARELSYTEFPCVFYECTDDEAKLLNVALNRITGIWEQDKLAELLGELRDADVNLAASGFSDDELNELLDRLGDGHGPSEFSSPDTDSGLVTCPRCAFAFRPGTTSPA